MIGVELGEHAATHCVPRLSKVIDGEPVGIGASVDWWGGGGGLRFMKLGAPVFDDAGRIHPDVRFETLAAFVWQQETSCAFDPAQARAGMPLLGVHCYKNNNYPRPLRGRCSPFSYENSDTTPAPEAEAPRRASRSGSFPTTSRRAEHDEKRNASC